ncbi:MAG: aromatic ring-hydroxylating dioxygenase subunit alpha [Rhodospirillaceae bacterium]|jgi:choline monooxygenase|nr:aromatic ring-hydroxylating dioxygenase subunit alpha [Rhodospirillaceae bacterium]MBT6118702.1 aromatic ring-hydroxylating dioxygenase subunit alpha [Rhodospirillaceae bacterium]
MPDGIRDVAGLFDAAVYTASRRPVGDPGATGLPPHCYTSEDWYRAEVERIFMRSWIFLGRVQRVPEAGDYLALDYAGVPLLILRGRDGVLRAFANSCRHRGAKLLEGEGNCRGIACPYHGWAYGLDGSLRGAPGMERSAGFDKAEHGLKPVRLETWGGFMFVCMDPEASDLATWLGDLSERLGPYDFEDMVPTYRVEYDLACNWKIMVENFLEYYHTPYVHRASIYSKPVAFLGQDDGQMADLSPEPGPGERVCFFMPHEGTRALMDGDAGFDPMPRLAGHRHEAGTYSGCILPAAMFSCHQDCMWFLEIYPEGPARTKVVQVGCFPKAATERPDFDEVAAHYYKRWGLVMGEDLAMIESVQRGLEGPFAEAGPVHHVEDKIHAIRRWWLDRMLDGPVG